MATVRRRHATALVQQVLGLREYAGREDFSVYTFPLLKKVQEVLEALQSASEEGNTRLILRQVRHSLRNGGHESYRREEARVAATAVLQRLMGEEVLPRDAEAAFDTLYDAGLDLVGAPLPTHPVGGGPLDEPGETEVPR